MPLPKPKPNESRLNYIARFMSETKGDQSLSREQRLAISYRKWRESRNGQRTPTSQARRTTQ